jgi:hypothetical protein
MGERHNSGFKKLLDLHFIFIFSWLFYFNLKKFAKKIGKFHQLFETTNEKLKTSVGGGLPLG